MEKSSKRSIWTGAIAFGLVTIPVRLYTAVHEMTLHFRMLHDQDHMPVRQRLVCSADGKEVHREHTVKGYEIEKDRYVVVRQDELEAAAPKSSKAIEILDFVALDEIDPLFFDRPYYVAPAPEGTKPYKLLLAAMEKTGKVGIARVVMHNKQYLAALRPIEGVLCLETMHFADELVSAESVPATGDHSKAKVDDRELTVALQLIDSLSAPFKPEKYHDEYRQQVLHLIQQKSRGRQIIERAAPAQPKAPRGHDLIAALEASLARARRSGGSNGTSARTHGTTRRRKSA